MKNKSLIITNIIILGCLVIGLLVFMIFGINGKLNFFENRTKLIDTISYEDNSLNNVKINVKSYDIEVIKSSTNKIEIEVYGSKKNKDNTKIENLNNSLNIYETRSIVCFGFCTSTKILIKLPDNYNGKYDINTLSGDIDFKVDLKSDDNNITTTSGDIYLPNILKGNITSTSGEIKIKSLEEGKVKTTSGDIEITKFQKGDVTSTSGEIEIEEFRGYGDIATTSGDIRLNNFEIKDNTNINSVSGDVRIKLINEAYVIANSTSGDKDIRATKGEYDLRINTVSGDITVR